MTYVVASALGALALIAYAYFGTVFAPPVAYPAYWACIVAGAGLLPIGDHRLSLRAQLVFLAGGFAFCVGGTAVRLLRRPADAARASSAGALTPERRRLLQRAMIAYSLLLAAAIPFFVAAIRAAGAALGVDDFATAARLSLGLADRAGIPSYFLSAASLAMFLAYYGAWIYDGSRRDKLALGAITGSALVMNGLTFGRSPIVALLLGIVSILALRRVVRTTTVASTLVITVGLAVTMGALLNKGPDFETGKSRSAAVVDNLAIYFIGGPVGFSTVMDDPGSVGDPGLSLRGPKRVLAWLGVKSHMPEDVLGYSTTDLGNVFTFYYPYWYDARWLGVVLAALAAGIVSTWVYEAARAGHPIAGAAFGLITGATLTSAVGDGLFATPMQWLLVVIIGWLLWHAPTLGRDPSSRVAGTA